MTDEYTYFADLAGLVPDAPSDSIVSRTIDADERLKVSLFSFAAGQELSEHAASTTAVLHFLKGEAKLTLGADAVRASAGTWVRLPPKMPHSVVAETPTAMLLLMIKTD